jgi:hypothetical protein
LRCDGRGERQQGEGEREARSCAGSHNSKGNPLRLCRNRLPAYLPTIYLQRVAATRFGIYFTNDSSHPANGGTKLDAVR